MMNNGGRRIDLNGSGIGNYHRLGTVLSKDSQVLYMVKGGFAFLNYPIHLESADNC